MNQPTGELEYRTATQTSVNYAKRLVELVVLPYETETVVEHRGRMVREVISRGAFDGIERRANRVRVNRDHDVTRTVGRALSFYPSRDEGLVAELRIAQTELGDETLALADEGILDASAGFMPMPDGETWPDRNLRRVEKAWLAHIAMTPDPAYETARVLSVRSQAPTGAVVVATPNLDRIRASVLEDMYSRLSR
jgi:HK97 family phage prohead protease